MDPAALSLAVVAGAVAAVNPCGFALLPAYLTMLVTAPDDGAGRVAAVARAVRFTTGMTTGFVVVFGGFALLVAPLALAVERWLPVLTVVIGLVLCVLGVALLAGSTMAVPGLRRRQGRPPGRTWLSQAGYGVTFAVASLSCTLAPFLAVMTSALRGVGAVGVAVTFVVYALGMGAVVGVLALAASTASAGMAAQLRRAAPLVSRAGGLLLLVAGGYVAWYGWFELRVLAGTAVDDPVVSAATGVQSALVRWVAGLGAGGIAVAAAGVVAAVLAVVVLGAARRRAQPTHEPAGTRR